MTALVVRFPVPIIPCPIGGWYTPMSPLPSPEERRKRLKILGLEPSSRRAAPLPGRKSAAAEERAQQQKEGRRRSKQSRGD